MKKIIIIGIVIFGVVVIIGGVGHYITERNENNDRLEGISYNVPKEFERSDYGEYYHYYGGDVSCDFEIDDFSTYSYESGKEYLENYVIIHLSDEVSEIKEVDLNGDLWYSFSKKNDSGISYYYAIVKDDKGYYLEYAIRDYYHGDYSGNENNFCKASYGEVISSVKLK